MAAVYDGFGQALILIWQDERWGRLFQKYFTIVIYTTAIKICVICVSVILPDLQFSLYISTAEKNYYCCIIVGFASTEMKCFKNTKLPPGSCFVLLKSCAKVKKKKNTHTNIMKVLQSDRCCVQLCDHFEIAHKMLTWDNV